ncbi:MAG: 4-hydroxythreonine-4-phosphate dehydrogenase PdxA [Rikenellaceae bacterium]|jgi:4-hydroxythreonine-4-phosphate dehydrogenase|nr:4-hydroxythreonine-4-phosphate dehydrogenase PdxA [Rikenellaceae bacterium]
MSAKIKVGITQGDSHGVGWEVILKSLADPRVGDFMIPVVYGSQSAADFYIKGLEEVANMQFSIVEDARKLASRGINLVNIDTEKVEITPGIPTAASGAAAVKALQRAASDLRAGNIDVLVTAPLSKENSRGEGFDYSGHTEFLAAEFGGEPTMMMCSDVMRVALVTSHIALADVPEAISKGKIVDKLHRLRATLIADFGVVEPRIAVLALNPHGGEGGMMGTDEAEVIKPAIDEAFGAGILAFGPFPADGLFLAGEYTKYDAVLAMYHDQGLAPFKALSPDGVNFTAGLDVVRTSPDHGTAFDIAGKGVASPDAMRNAIYTAIDILRHRRAWVEMSHNPLKHYEREKGADITIDLSKSPDEL